MENVDTRSDKSELLKFILLSVIFFLIIGVYWFLRPIKDGVFITMLGAQYLPYIKIISAVAVFPIIGFYGYLIDKFTRDRVFYLVTLLFGVLTLFFGFCLNHPVYGVYSTQFSLIKAIIGVSLCIYVKIFGSVMVAMFWSFVADTTTPESASKNYYLISAGGQIGNVVGPLFVGLFARNLGVVSLSFLAGVLILVILPIMFCFIKVVPKNLLQGFCGKNTEIVERRPGLWQGFKFLVSNKYLLSIYATISIFEIVQAILDFRFKTLIGSIYTGDELIEFLGKFGAMTGLVAIICLFVGTRLINKKFGLGISLLVLPLVMIFLVLCNIYTHVTVAMWVLILTRAINYALNQPSKEQLYITMTTEAKYKAKAWIEIFGTRTSEAFAQGVNLLNISLGSLFLPFSTFISVALLGLWLLLGKFLSKTHKKAVDENEFIC